MLQVEIITNDDYKISVGRSLLSDSVLRNNLYPGRKYFKLMPGTSDLTDISGEKCLIIGKEYIINNRRYDLESGYGIVAKLTPDFCIYPELRRAVGKEIGVIKNEHGFGILDRWPILENIETEETETILEKITETTEDKSFIFEAMHFDVSDENFSEYNYDSNEEENSSEE